MIDAGRPVVAVVYLAGAGGGVRRHGDDLSCAWPTARRPASPIATADAARPSAPSLHARTALVDRAARRRSGWPCWCLGVYVPPRAGRSAAPRGAGRGSRLMSATDCSDGPQRPGRSPRPTARVLPIDEFRASVIDAVGAGGTTGGLVRPPGDGASSACWPCWPATTKATWPSSATDGRRRVPVAHARLPAGPLVRTRDLRAMERAAARASVAQADPLPAAAERRRHARPTPSAA